jgi:chromosome segregation ATPase
MTDRKGNDTQNNPQAVTDDAACGTCPSGEVVSSQEQWILEEMRSLKETMRPVADRLKTLEDRIKDPPLTDADNERNQEWAKLEGQMSDLRDEWQKWQERLDEAIQQKLVCLGHREPAS